MQFDNAATAFAISNNGQAKALAVTSQTRSKVRPDLPTLSESGVPGFEALTWLGLLAPAGISPNLITFLNKEVVTILDSPIVKSKLAAQEFSPKPSSPDSFRKFIQDETQKFSDLIKTNNLVID